jgi:PIN domain nuclease of toxin-antitoxin system
VSLEHAERVAELQPHHSDPFDRLLIAQALTENATIVTHDHGFSPYGVRILWT